MVNVLITADFVDGGVLGIDLITSDNVPSFDSTSPGLIDVDIDVIGLINFFFTHKATNKKSRDLEKSRLQYSLAVLYNLLTSGYRVAMVMALGVGAP